MVIALAGTSAQASTLTFNSYADGAKTQQSQQAIHMLQNDFVLDHGTSRFDAYDENYQDQVYATPKDLTAPVPEPSIYAMMLAGLAAAGLCARRRASHRR